MNSALQFPPMHNGIHDRGDLPHRDFADSLQAVTFRLAASLPKKVVEEWRKELEVTLASPDIKTSRAAKADLHKRVTRYEDAGHGSRILSKPECAGIVQEALIKSHGSIYKLSDWCVMPNHVHVLFRMMDHTSLGNIVKGWKASSAIQINRLEKQSGSLWMCDYHDRFIRDLDHFHNARTYIRNNPVKAGLCATPEDWPFSSAAINWTAEFIPPDNKEVAE